MTTVDSMRVIGTKTRDRVEVTNNSQTVIPIKVSTETIKLTEKEFSLGQTKKSMMENGKMELSKAMVFGKEYMGILILGSGKTARLKAMEFMFGKMVKLDFC